MFDSSLFLIIKDSDDGGSVLARGEFFILEDGSVLIDIDCVNGDCESLSQLD